MALFKDDDITPQEKTILKRLLIASWYRQKERRKRYFTFEEFCKRIKERLSSLSLIKTRKTTTFLFESICYSASKKKIINTEETLFGIKTIYYLHATNGEFENELESTQQPTF